MITAVGIDDATFLESLYPGMLFVRADGRDLPFDDNSFDHVHSSAVLEHVGTRAQQVQFLKELWRVTRRTLLLRLQIAAFRSSSILCCLWCIGCRQALSARYCARPAAHFSLTNST